MGSELSIIDPATLALMRESLRPGGELHPFARDIMLIECHVAGTTHRDLSEIAPQIVPGLLLVLFREPDNRYDPLAIKILDEHHHDLGYVPRAKNEALARLMDAGKMVFGRVESCDWRGGWLVIEARMFMRDY